jgi:Flp pilus assembly pilin Flp
MGKGYARTQAHSGQINQILFKDNDLRFRRTPEWRGEAHTTALRHGLVNSRRSAPDPMKTQAFARRARATGKDRERMQFLKKLLKDERGGEVLEYALIAGLIVVAAIAVITSVGGKVLAKWQSINSSM